jgi:glycosyltransferase involved in cell wall biosynthesis
MLARADDRGLGTLTQEFHKNMRPERTLVVLTRDPDFPDHPERFSFGEKTLTPLGPNLTLDEAVVREFLDGLEVVYTAETFYDWRIVKWAREMSVKTVVHGMPELTRHHREALPKPDQWWWPTDWLTHKTRLPKGKIVPIPTTGKMNLAGHPNEDGPLRVLHPGGKFALADRDGTKIFMEALKYVTEEIHVTLAAQDREFDPLLPSNVTIESLGHVEDRWDLYRGQHVTVLPRRYGGLSLKVQESLDCGVPVILPDIEPNRMWPGQRVPALPGPVVRVPYGSLPTWDTEPHAIAEQLDDLASHRSLLQVDQLDARAWASANTWTHHKSLYRRELEAVL